MSLDQVCGRSGPAATKKSSAMRSGTQGGSLSGAERALSRLLGRGGTEHAARHRAYGVQAGREERARAAWGYSALQHGSAPARHAWRG